MDKDNTHQTFVNLIFMLNLLNIYILYLNILII